MAELASLLPLVGIALLFWLLIIRPASRRNKELGRMQSSLSLGDEVVLTSGIFGTLTALDDDQVHVEIAEGVTIKVARGAIGTVAQTEQQTGQQTDQQLDPHRDPAEPEEI